MVCCHNLLAQILLEYTQARKREALTLPDACKSTLKVQNLVVLESILARLKETAKEENPGSSEDLPSMGTSQRVVIISGPRRLRPPDAMWEWQTHGRPRGHQSTKGAL